MSPSQPSTPPEREINIAVVFDDGDDDDETPNPRRPFAVAFYTLLAILQAVQVSGADLKDVTTWSVHSLVAFVTFILIWREGHSAGWRAAQRSLDKLFRRRGPSGEKMDGIILVRDK